MKLICFHFRNVLERFPQRLYWWVYFTLYFDLNVFTPMNWYGISWILGQTIRTEISFSFLDLLDQASCFWDPSSHCWRNLSLASAFWERNRFLRKSLFSDVSFLLSPTIPFTATFQSASQYLYGNNHFYTKISLN